MAVQLTFGDAFMQRAVFHPARAARMAETMTRYVLIAADDLPMMVLSACERCHGEQKTRHQNNAPAGHAAFSNDWLDNKPRTAIDFLILRAVPQGGRDLGSLIFLNAAELKLPADDGTEIPEPRRAQFVSSL
jgi:hypothetical protein